MTVGDPVRPRIVIAIFWTFWASGQTTLLHRQVGRRLHAQICVASATSNHVSCFHTCFGADALERPCLHACPSKADEGLANIAHMLRLDGEQGNCLVYASCISSLPDRRAKVRVLLAISCSYPLALTWGGSSPPSEAEAAPSETELPSESDWPLRSVRSARTDLVMWGSTSLSKKIDRGCTLPADLQVAVDQRLQTFSLHGTGTEYGYAHRHTGLIDDMPEQTEVFHVSDQHSSSRNRDSLSLNHLEEVAQVPKRRLEWMNRVSPDSPLCHPLQHQLRRRSAGCFSGSFRANIACFCFLVLLNSVGLAR